MFQRNLEPRTVSLEPWTSNLASSPLMLASRSLYLVLSCERQLLAASCSRAGGDDEGRGEDERAAGAGAGAEALAQQEDAEQRSDEGLHVKQNSGLRDRDLGEPPVPQQGSGRGAEQTAGGQREPDFERDGRELRRPKGLGIDQRDADEKHGRAAGDAVCGDRDRAVALHEAFIHENPGEGDDQRKDDQQVSGEGGGWIA